MSGSFMDFLESEGPLPTNYRKEVEVRVAPILHIQKNSPAEGFTAVVTRSRFASKVLLEFARVRSTLTPRRLAFSGGALTAAAAAVALWNSGYLTQEPQQQAPAPLTLQAPTLTPDPALQLLAHELDQVLASRSKKAIEPSKPNPATIARAQSQKRTTPKITPRIAIEIVRNVDLLLVLHLVKDLEVLKEWNGTTAFWFQFPTFVSEAYAAEEPIHLTDDFLDQMFDVFPQIPVREQASFLKALRRLKANWATQKEVISANYDTWKKSSPEQRRQYDRNLITWKGMSETSKNVIASKYERWKKLSAQEQSRIRLKLTGRKS